MKKKSSSGPLKICLLTYRGNPTCGGQGVYIRHLSKALADEGHQVDVISGPPYPHLDDPVRLIQMPGLDLYHPDHLFWPEHFGDLVHPLNLYEFLSVCAGGFPEPYTFGERVYDYLKKHRGDYDI
ncbi:MAG TPA: glycosyltransferase, partial [Smithellaceae bacterium]|nr:glycosyltransferase [Smithellaceae bacterium]